MRFFSKLILKSILLITPFVFITLVYNNGEVMKNKYDLGKFDSVPESIEVANLGSSHGFIAFDYSIPEYDNLICINLALQQQTLDFDYAILKQYINNFRENSTLIICLSSFETNGKPDYETDITSRLRYYQFLTPENFESFSYREYFCTKYLSIFSSRHPLEEIGQIINNLGYKRTSSKKKYADISAEEKIEQANELVKHWIKTIPPSDEGKMFNLHYIDLIMKLCNEHHIKTVFVTTPISREVFNALHQQQVYYDMKAFQEELSAKYPDALFLNYIDLYFDRNNLLGDNNHLSKRGGRIFSRRVYSDLKKSGYLK